MKNLAFRRWNRDIRDFGHLNAIRKRPFLGQNNVIWAVRVPIDSMVWYVGPIKKKVKYARIHDISVYLIYLESRTLHSSDCNHFRHVCCLTNVIKCVELHIDRSRGFIRWGLKFASSYMEMKSHNTLCLALTRLHKTVSKWSPFTESLQDSDRQLLFTFTWGRRTPEYTSPWNCWWLRGNLAIYTAENFSFNWGTNIRQLIAGIIFR